MQINEPEALAEVTAAFALYEAALMANDLEAMDALFWDNPLTVRLGVGENLYGMDAIRAFRAGRGGSPQRTLANTVITTFGRDFATANTEFHRRGAGRPGRQSQAWARLEGGWKIVSAHVSLLGEGS
jgi:ketosteroid isomerase-like protein